MKKNNLKQIKDILIVERKALLERQQEGENLLESERVRNPDRSDLAWSYNQRQRKEAMQARTEKQLEEIDDALKRIENGKYGTCTNCGKEIPPERLRAIPWAALCVQCQQEQER